MFKDVLGYEGRYQISDFGEVVRIGSGRGVKPNRVLKLSPHACGYLAVFLWKNNKTKGFLVHRLVAATFIGAIPEGFEVNHKNGIKTDNRVQNLEIVSRQENIDHAIRIGLINNTGVNNGQAKLSEKDVIEIKCRYIRGRVGYKQLSAQYGVSPECVRDIIKGRNWRHVS